MSISKSITNVFRTLAKPLLLNFRFFTMMYALGIVVAYSVVPNRPNAHVYDNLWLELFADVYVVCALLVLLPAKVRRWVRRLCAAAAYMAALADVFCFVRFQSTLNPTMLLLAFETDKREAGEFFSGYVGADLLQTAVGWVVLLMAIHAVWWIAAKLAKRLPVLRQGVPVAVVAVRKRLGIGIGPAEVKVPVLSWMIPSPLPGILYQILAAQEVNGILKVNLPDGVVVGDGGDLVVRNPLRHPLPAPDHRDNPAFPLVRHQIRASGIGITVSAYKRADDVNGFAGGTRMLDGGCANFVNHAALSLVFTGKALVGSDAHAVFVGITVPGGLTGELEPEIGTAHVIGRDMVDVQHRFTVLVFVMAEIDITVGGGVTSGNDAETEQRKQDRAHDSPGVDGFCTKIAIISFKSSGISGGTESIHNQPLTYNPLRKCAEDYT